MGCTAAVALNPIPVEEMAEKLIMGSYSRAWRVSILQYEILTWKKSYILFLKKVQE